MRRIPDHSIIHNSGTSPVHAHIGGRFIYRRFPGYLFENPSQQGKSLYVTIIINSFNIVGFQVMMIYLNKIFQIYRSCFISDINLV